MSSAQWESAEGSAALKKIRYVFFSSAIREKMLAYLRKLTRELGSKSNKTRKGRVDFNQQKMLRWVRQNVPTSPG